ncbi:MAG: methyltransferase domain-containing protein [Halanaeroarchaeum sp.]
MGFLEDKTRARRFYKHLSKVYDRVNPYIWNESMRARALEMLDIGGDDRVLDVGCGTGFGTEGLLQYTDDIYGLDQSEHQLARARAKLDDSSVTFMRGDAERLPVETDEFDHLWSSGSIEYWPHPVRALEEFRRVVKPGGQVLVVGPNHPPWPVIQQIMDSIMLFYDVDEAQRMFEAAGFDDIEHQEMGPENLGNLALVTVATVPEN